jgi:hypothetical protein
MPPLVILSCKVLQSLMERHLAQSGVPAIFMDYGLHRTPQLMTPALQEVLDGLPEPSVVVLGYGLCGNGLAGLRAGRHRLIVPRADDCIMMLLGSYDRYLEEFTAEPGTYYLTKGWLESGSHPLKEYRELLEKYDQETADWLMDEQYHNYKRIVLVAPNQEELEAYRAQAREVADFCAERWGFRYEEMIGSAGFIERLMTDAHRLPESTDDFLVIPPGGEIRQEIFFRL